VFGGQPPADLPVDDVPGGPWVAGPGQAPAPATPGGRVGLRPRSHTCCLPGIRATVMRSSH